MKRIMLMHESGKEYGPYTMNDEGWMQGFESILNIAELQQLGFTYRPYEPEKITVTKEAWAKASGWAPNYIDDMWAKLVKESKK